jgi:mannose-6-phosphate isomerase-like protein (cupin superfamily)
MTEIIPSDDIRIPGSETLRFEGAAHGSGVSFYLVTAGPGRGPELHRHPYSETWTVLDGEASIRVGDDLLLAHAGDTAVVASGVWHGFTNSGPGMLRIVCIHASPEMIQEDAVDGA